MQGRPQPLFQNLRTVFSRSRQCYGVERIPVRLGERRERACGWKGAEGSRQESRVRRTVFEKGNAMLITVHELEFAIVKFLVDIKDGQTEPSLTLPVIFWREELLQRHDTRLHEVDVGACKPEGF